MTALAIQLEEALPLLLHVIQVGQLCVRPHMGHVILVKPFDAPIAFWVVEGGEDQLRAHEQRHTQHFAQYPRVGPSATKARFVIYLGVLCNPYCYSEVD